MCPPLDDQSQRDSDPFRSVAPLPASGDDAAAFDVVISGAGPVGLLLGCHLRSVGARVAIVDPHLNDGTATKAAVTMPRTFEVLARAGGEVASRISSEGRMVRKARLGSNGAWVGDLSGFSGGLAEHACRFHPTAVGQDVLVRTLSRRYMDLGGAIFRGARVKSAEEREGSVAVGVERHVYVRPPAVAPPIPQELAALMETSLSAKYLVGADGKNSTVRELLGLGFVGHEYEQVFFLSDIEVKEGEAERCGWDGHEGTIISEASGAMLLFVHIQGSVFRTYYCSAETEPSNCTEEFLRAQWEKNIPGGFPCKIRRFEKPALFRVSCRIAESYTSSGGRIYLAGDAAHCHSPAGGQGMNTGIQDAANLAWKLGAVLRGEASPDGPLLGTYEAERRPIAEWVLETSDAVFSMATAPQSPLFNSFRNLFLRMVLAVAPEGSLPPGRVRDKVFGLSHSYRDVGSCVNSGETPPQGALLAGDRLPDLPLRRLNEISVSEEKKGEPKYLHELLGPLSTQLTLLVISGGREAEAQSKGMGAVATAFAACTVAAAKLDNVSNTVFVALADAVNSEGAIPSPVFQGGRILAVDGVDVTTNAFCQARDKESEAPATIASRLCLRPTDAAVLAVRPDMYLGLIHRGNCDPTALVASLKDTQRNIQV